ncbi:MAG TPA: phosphopantothenoylcysteine decarboxylase [Planctomycetota bacterium]
MKVLVTAGPTREPIDPVRFLSNRSSGRMGFSIVRGLVAAGHEVMLVSGPVALRAPKLAAHARIETAEEMLMACRRLWPHCDAVIAAAAVADWRPAHASADKLKRTADAAPVLELVPNPDILAELATTKGDRIAIGFALETGDGRVEALRKLRVKGLDFIALNGPEAQGAERATLRLFDAAGRERVLGPSRKDALARALIRHTLGPA